MHHFEMFHWLQASSASVTFETHSEDGLWKDDHFFAVLVGFLAASSCWALLASESWVLGPADEFERDIFVDPRNRGWLCPHQTENRMYSWGLTIKHLVLFQKKRQTTTFYNRWERCIPRRQAAPSVAYRIQTVTKNFWQDLFWVDM